MPRLYPTTLLYIGGQWAITPANGGVPFSPGAGGARAQGHDPVSLSQSYLPRAWAPLSVRAVLHNEAYRGMSVWSHL